MQRDRATAVCCAYIQNFTVQLSARRDCNPGIPNLGIPGCFSILKSRDYARPNPRISWTVSFSSRSGLNEFSESEVTCRAARALNNKKNIMLTVHSIAENIAESIAFTYIGETHGQNSEVNVCRQW